MPLFRFGDTSPLQRPKQQVEPVVPEEDFAVAHNARHAEHAARISLGRPFRQSGSCCRIEGPRQRFGLSARLREALRQHGGIGDVLLLLPERVEYGMGEIRTLAFRQ